MPHASGFRTILSLATQHHVPCDHVDISLAFVQGDLLPGDGYNGKVYISPTPGFTEDDGYVYQLRRPLYGMPSAARAWRTTMSAYLKSQRCSLVGFERSMWYASIGGHTILIAAHIDDFIDFWPVLMERTRAPCTLTSVALIERNIALRLFVRENGK